MVINFSLQSAAARLVVILAGITICILLLRSVFAGFVIGTLSDPRTGTDRNLIIKASEFYPDSALLLARLAETEMSAPKPDYKLAESHILQAINLSPNKYYYRLLLAEIRDYRGDQTGAEQALKDALKLAPNDSEIHWKLANLFVRMGKLDESIKHFQVVARLNQRLIPATFDLIWTISGENSNVLQKIVEDNPKAQLKLAIFLANKGQTTAAASTFELVNLDIVRSSPEVSSFFGALIAKGFPVLANELWLRVFNNKSSLESKVFNGDFEIEGISGSDQFDWKIGKSEYARIEVDNRTAHSGSRSLLINFLDKDTAKLDEEVKHLIALRGGTSYQLEYFVKTENLRTPEGPQVVVTDNAGKWLAQSEPISSEIENWKPMSLVFTAPQNVTGDGSALFISIKRKPRYAYDEPTKGKIWFDDFAVMELKGK